MAFLSGLSSRTGRASATIRDPGMLEPGAFCRGPRIGAAAPLVQGDKRENQRGQFAHYANPMPSRGLKPFVGFQGRGGMFYKTPSMLRVPEPAPPIET